jgi:CubicO group peptidase (beta-lactamase class C family)
MKSRPDRIRWLAAALSCLAIASCGSGVSDPQERTFQNATAEHFDIEALASAFHEAREIEDLRSLVVARDFEILAEIFQNNSGSGPDPELHVMSVTKSVTATLVGIAIDMGFIESVDQTISDFFGQEVDTVNAALGEVTLHQLMTMTPGHEWREITETSEFSAWVTAEDQLLYIFNKPIVHEPGTVFDYSDGAAHLVSAILWKATGMNTTDFADQYLFEPMGLGVRGWYGDNRGISYGGVGLLLGPHDMIEFGNLYLNRGNLNGIQIVSSQWIERAPSPTVASRDHIARYPQYGYYWWLSSSGGHDCSCAIGYGGQYILVCPDLAMVVVATADYRGRTTQEAGANWAAIGTVIDEILAAAR